MKLKKAGEKSNVKYLAGFTLKTAKIKTAAKFHGLQNIYEEIFTNSILT